jgi:hypothetical protein
MPLGSVSKQEKLPVLRPWGGLCYLAPVHEVRQLIRAGLAKAFGPGRRLDGAILFAGPSRWQAGTRYVHDREVSDTWTDGDGIVHTRDSLDGNVRGAYTLKRLSHLDRALFREVETSCLR